MMLVHYIVRALVVWSVIGEQTVFEISSDSEMFVFHSLIQSISGADVRHFRGIEPHHHRSGRHQSHASRTWKPSTVKGEPCL